MDRNFVLAIGLSLMVWVLWTSFLAPPPPPPEEAGEPVAEEALPGAAAPEPESPAALPALEAPEPDSMAAAATPAPPPEPRGESRTIRIESELYFAEFDTRGAGIRHWELVEYETGPNEGSVPVELTTGEAPHDSVLVTPLSRLGLGDLSQELFEVVEEGPERLVFRLSRDGITVTKTYALHRDSYAFDLTVRVDNASGRGVEPLFPVTWPAAHRPGQDFREQSLTVLHQGSVSKEPLRSFGKPGFFGGGEPEEHFVREVDWAGVGTTYFIGAVLPDDPAQASARFVATVPGHAGVVQLYFPAVQIPPGQSAERAYRVYIGPKEPGRLEALGGELIRTIDLGWSWLRPLTRFFGWILQVLYGFVPNYGVAIIVLTVLVRLVTTPLTTKQMRSMERMRALAPKLQELKEKYADDRQKQSEQMMALYRQEGVNPLGGCFPMVLQLPVFIGLFYALRSSIQLRQAPFVGWIHDLSAPETLFVLPGLDVPVRLLPLVMGASMYLQQRITPMQQMDPAQQRMMMIMMPLMMTFISYTFPSGLVLYWMVSNFLAIAHQLWIGRTLRK